MKGAVVFDLNGVLVFDVWETVALDPVNGLAVQYGLDFQEVEQFGHAIWRQYALTFSKLDWQEEELDYWNHWQKRFQLPVTAQQLVWKSLASIREVPGMMPLVERLVEQEVELAVCTNNNAFWLRRQLDLTGIDHLIPGDRIVSSHQIGHEKSSPGHEMFEAVQGRLKTERERCVFVDDRPENLRRAEEFGWRGILFPAHSPDGMDLLSRELAFLILS